MAARTLRQSGSIAYRIGLGMTFDSGILDTRWQRNLDQSVGLAAPWLQRASSCA